mmetsp:Transcript_27055/g.53967  ORF Transcript_27055/g.53967 Transcript_27055/m.53967 type:complete len:163 (-) Transcript_27055:622-1110(-)
MTLIRNVLFVCASIPFLPSIMLVILYILLYIINNKRPINNNNKHYIYKGYVKHIRMKRDGGPGKGPSHSFTYPVFFVYLDLKSLATKDSKRVNNNKTPFPNNADNLSFLYPLNVLKIATFDNTNHLKNTSTSSLPPMPLLSRLQRHLSSHSTPPLPPRRLSS